MLPAVKLRSAVFQGPSATEDVAANLQTINDVLVEALAMGVDLVLFPELYLHGYDARALVMRRLALDTSLYGRISRGAALEGGAGLEPLVRISDMARECGVAVAFGYCERGGKERFYNSCMLFDAEGSLVLNYRKTHLWDAGEASGALSHERRIFTPGDALPVADLVLPVARRGIDERIPPRFKQKSSLRRARAITVRVGILICFDGEFPEPARCLAAQGAQIILLPTALGSGPVEVLTPNVTVPQRAAENHVFILYSNLTGPCHPRCGSRMFVGRSAVLGPDGYVVDGARAASDGGDTSSVMLVADLDSAAYASCVTRNDYLALRRPELYARSGLGAGVATRARTAAVRSPLSAARAAGVASSKRGYFSRVDSPSPPSPTASPTASPGASPGASPPLPPTPPG
jgi:predicted amidohydrolase